MHDKAPIHKSMIAQQAVHDCGFVQLDHPTYSADLAPSDYFLFRNLKSHLRGVRYPDDEALKEAVKERNINIVTKITSTCRACFYCFS